MLTAVNIPVTSLLLVHVLVSCCRLGLALYLISQSYGLLLLVVVVVRACVSACARARARVCVFDHLCSQIFPFRIIYKTGRRSAVYAVKKLPLTPNKK